MNTKGLKKGMVIPLFSMLLFAGNSFGQKNNWKHFTSSQFPALVKEIDFPNGNNITKSSSVKWGSWTVSFVSSSDDSLPIIEEYSCGYDIHRLTAHNDIIGDIPCHICLMVRMTDGSAYTPTWTMTNSSGTFFISPPSEIKFK